MNRPKTISVNKHNRRAFRLALLACALVVSYLASAPLEEVPGTTSDKLNHILAFVVLAWLADRSFPGRHLESYRWFFLLGYGLGIEVIQGFLPFRELSLLDLAADTVGILCYSATSRMGPLRASLSN